MDTNYDALEPVSYVKRWSSAAIAKVDVPQPHGIFIRDKKWWWVIFTNMINIAIVNA